MFTEIEARIYEEYRRLFGAESVEEWIENAADNLSILGADKAGCIRLNHQVRTKRNVREVTYHTRFGGLARLVSVDGESFRIELDRRITRVSTRDRRFWIAHELAHTYLVKACTMDYLSHTRQVTGNDSVDEWICNRLAAAILVPMWVVEDRGGVDEVAHDFGEQLWKLSAWADVLDVPERMLARRLFHDLAGIDDILLRLEPRKNGGVGFECKWAALPPRFSREDRKRVERAVFPNAIVPTLKNLETASGNSALQLQKWLEKKVDGIVQVDETTQLGRGIDSRWSRYSSIVYGRILLSS